MNKRHFFLIAAGLAFAIFSPLHGKEAKPFALRDGDIVFSGSAAGQGSAIIAATDSPFTHGGIVFQKEGRWMVLEAMHPVSVATLEAFMPRSRK
jgi:hypothetical protein